MSVEEAKDIFAWIGALSVPFFFIIGILEIIYKSKISYLKRMNKLVDKYIKKYGYSPTWEFGDYIYKKNKKLAYWVVPNRLLEKYYPIKNNVYQVAGMDYVHLIATVYTLRVFRDYRSAMGEYIIKFEMFKEDDVPALLPKFSKFALDEYGNRNKQLDNDIINKVIDPLVQNGILKKTYGRDGSVIYQPVHREASNVVNKGGMIVD